MKPGTFALNPHAVSYIPLSKRMGYGGGDDGLVFAKSSTHITQGQQINFSGIEVSMPNKSTEFAYKQFRDDDLDLEMDIDMDIEYLNVTFSGLSHESIADVYLANNGDVEATIEMLNQLEIYSNDSQDTLPEKLDIGNISESGPSTSLPTEVTASSSSIISNAPVSA